MRIRSMLSVLTVAGALLLPLVSTPAVLPAQAATHPLLYGLIDKWDPQIASDENQLNVHSGIVGTFFDWHTVKPSSGVNWFNWVRGRGGVPMLDLYPPTTDRLAGIAAGADDTDLK